MRPHFPQQSDSCRNRGCYGKSSHRGFGQFSGECRLDANRDVGCTLEVEFDEVEDAPHFHRTRCDLAPGHEKRSVERSKNDHGREMQAFGVGAEIETSVVVGTETKRSCLESQDGPEERLLRSVRRRERVPPADTADDEADKKPEPNEKDRKENSERELLIPAWRSQKYRHGS